jgi:hypothetical protein
MDGRMAGDTQPFAFAVRPRAARFLRPRISQQRGNTIHREQSTRPETWFSGEN